MRYRRNATRYSSVALDKNRIYQSPRLVFNIIDGRQPIEIVTDHIYRIELTRPDIGLYKMGNTILDHVPTRDGGRPGPHVIVNALPHGNEYCGAIRKPTRRHGRRLRRLWHPLRTLGCYYPLRIGAARAFSILIESRVFRGFPYLV